VVLLGAILMILLLAAVLTAIVGTSPAFVASRASRTASARRWDNSSPYKNTRPEVKYVGDESCVRCHGEIAKTYRRHPMGRSLSPIATATATGGDEGNGRPLFEAQGLQYSIERREGRVIHKETRRDTSGRIVAQNEGEVRYVVGSGRRGLTYLVGRDDFLVESPITWYSQAGRWGLSPGYGDLNYHFDRSVQVACLFCHANRVEPVAGTLNRYRPPIFQGHSIGCERCHGPGELHATRPAMVDGEDMTIVNPADLKPSLRDAVCEQCHLSGAGRVERVGSRFEDYRPGLPLHRFWSVLVPASGPAESRFVGQVEQMHESRCFRASQGRLGCISCHDPHRLPTPDERVTYYRNRCLECHADRGCSLPARLRLMRSRDDDCAGCHMPRSKSTDIPHVATTDHRIARQGVEGDRSPPQVEGQRPGRSPLVNFHRDLMAADELAEANRDIGVAICRDGPAGAAKALPWLEAALVANPDDVAAWQAKGVSLVWLGRAEEGLAAFQRALKVDADRELLLKEAAHGAARAGQREVAIAYWRRAIAINPWRSDYQAALAPLYFEGRDWNAAAEACREALRLNFANLEVRKLLVQCHLRLGNAEAARAEFETILGFDPPDRNDLLQWFAYQLRAR
jgi:Flp pilus assembly protein TadD